MKKIKMIKKNSGYTLIELLITLFIFSIVAMITLSSVTSGFLSGRLGSNETKKLNQNMNLIFQTINLKMANANNSAKVSSNVIYGFKYIGGMLVIASQPAGGLPTDRQCTFLYLKPSTSSINMIQKACVVGTTAGSGTALPLLTDFNANNQISDKNIKITGFDVVTNSLPYTPPVLPSPRQAPYLSVKITATDLKGQITNTMQTYYGLQYDTVKNF